MTLVSRPPASPAEPARKLSDAEAAAILDRIAARLDSGEVDPARFAAYLDEKVAKERGDAAPDDGEPEE